ncbi:hypothetical protein AZE42_10442 [Rhizopogon vesiculosus]|uniref:Uncharacterized protein n=1 Tax=Rhizopogon vesiculosus TaxID=180088 RepID=A0A1J8QLG7_9AGAM|nr:hypothetical protein AZE42_10442 [Rhizopogon vesiculosus]
MRIREVEDDFPLLVTVFGPHGDPNVFLTEEMRGRAVGAGSSGDYIDIDKDRMLYTTGYMLVPLTHLQTKHPSKPKPKPIRKH